ncbi:hypothetical protein [Flavobacterium wongokense]|uniref:hypothetical protein n=1 Tax=Flavobacterium wongokense TaxID=2910674 RepID=UPI001F33830E|nr:hypothetical protein [Flavobacterium sp. WG47]MCF6132838.1 hypothetical protein [Flavobacterium sp. WG47]
MKKHLTILGILLALIVSGCSSDSNSSHASIVDGQWKLVHVSGSFAGISSDFAPGVITWDFNPTTQMVTVVNNNTDANLTDIFETGVYNYQIVANPDPQTCSQIIKIDNVEMGCFSIVNGNLEIDQAFADGFTVTLEP